MVKQKKIHLKGKLKYKKKNKFHYSKITGVNILDRKVSKKLLKKIIISNIKNKVRTTYQYCHREKQKLNDYYGKFLFYRFKKHLTNFKKGQYDLELFERRLDVIIFRTNLFTSLLEAKTFIEHYGVYVNNFIIKRPEFKIKNFDIIQIDLNHKKYLNLLNKSTNLPFKKRTTKFIFKSLNSNNFDLFFNKIKRMTYFFFISKTKLYSSIFSLNRKKIKIKKLSIISWNIKYLTFFLKNLFKKKVTVPEFLEFNYKTLIGIFLYKPTIKEIPYYIKIRSHFLSKKWL